MNPVLNGVILRCNVCESTIIGQRTVNMTENIKKHSEGMIYMTLEAKQLDKILNQDVLVMEAWIIAIVDTAYTKTVYVNEWLQYMLDLLSFVKNEKNHVPFKFEDGRIINSYQTVTFPAKISNHLCNLKTEVECKISLLLSNESLAKGSD